MKNIDQVDDRVFLNGTVLVVDLTELAQSLKLSLRTKPRLEVATISKVEGWLIPGEVTLSIFRTLFFAIFVQPAQTMLLFPTVGCWRFVDLGYLRFFDGGVFC